MVSKGEVDSRGKLCKMIQNHWGEPKSARGRKKIIQRKKKVEKRGKIKFTEPGERDPPPKKSRQREESNATEYSLCKEERNGGSTKPNSKTKMQEGNTIGRGQRTSREGKTCSAAVNTTEMAGSWGDLKKLGRGGTGGKCVGKIKNDRHRQRPGRRDQRQE